MPTFLISLTERAAPSPHDGERSPVARRNCRPTGDDRCRQPTMSIGKNTRKPVAAAVGSWHHRGCGTRRREPDRWR
jgi:hypothetical protein